MKRLTACLLIFLFLFTAVTTASAADTEAAVTDETADVSAPAEEEAEEEPDYEAAQVAAEPDTEAPTEEQPEEENPDRADVPKIGKVNFSYGNNENTLTLYADCGDEDADKYESMQRYGNLYRWYYKSANGWTRIGTTSENSFTWYPTERGRSYTFTVRCTDKDEKRFISDFDRNGYTMYYCRTPGSLKASLNMYGVRFSFDKCYGAKKYAVYRKTENGWKRIAVTTDGYYVDTGAVQDSINTYAVRCINDKETVFWSNFKHAGVSIAVGTLPNIKAGRDKVNKLLDHIADDIKKHPNGYYARPGIYWEESGIPKGNAWCTGFAHYVLNKGLGGYYACQWDDIKESPSYWHSFTSYWSRDAYYDGGIFYQPWDKTVPAKGDVVFFRKLGERDIFANVGHVGFVLKVYNDGSIDTIEGNVGGDSANTSRTTIVHYTKSGKTWVSEKRTVSGFIDLDKIIENGAKYPQNLK